jgi:methylenetetrahydrofolate dehydrogenase (NADP+)/methenyltetrahydrofolate cyclohydrolase
MAQKILNGAELGGFIKERQAKQVRALKQSGGIHPKLAIIRTNPDPVVDSYMRLKKGYGADIGIEVDVYTIDQSEAIKTIKKLNKDDSVNGIIVQLPIPDREQTDEIVNAVDGSKDVDGLSIKAKFDPATPLSIMWLLSGYNVELKGKKIVIVGKGKLVGAPLARIWRAQGLDVEIGDRSTKDLGVLLRTADIVIGGTGVPGLIKQDMLKPNAVVVDAGVASEGNSLVGDVDPSVRELPNITVTPIKGGVGPLTVCALFENVIRSAQESAK